jgi:hypothetical protein
MPCTDAKRKLERPMVVWYPDQPDGVGAVISFGGPNCEADECIEFSTRDVAAKALDLMNAYFGSSS